MYDTVWPPGDRILAPFREPGIRLYLARGVEELATGRRQADGRHVGNGQKRVVAMHVMRGERLTDGAAGGRIDPLPPDAPEPVAFRQEVDQVSGRRPECLAIEIRTVDQHRPLLFGNGAFAERGDVDSASPPFPN